MIEYIENSQDTEPWAQACPFCGWNFHISDGGTNPLRPCPHLVFDIETGEFYSFNKAKIKTGINDNILFNDEDPDAIIQEKLEKLSDKSKYRFWHEY